MISPSRYSDGMSEPAQHVASLLLTGGASRRMGRDKASLPIDGTTLARRTATLLQRVTLSTMEVGPGASGLWATREIPPGGGPLAAIAEGCRALRARGHEGDALIVACDLPFVSEDLLRFLVFYDAPGSVVPLVHGRAQPLLAKWGHRDLDDARDLVARGARSLRGMLSRPDVTFLDESAWGHVADDTHFADVDSPDDLRLFGLHLDDEAPPSVM